MLTVKLRFQWEVKYKMIKECCDICGKKKHIAKYKLPMYRKKYATDANNAKIMDYDVLVPCEMDVCMDCAIVINSIIGSYPKMKKTELPMVDIDDGDGIHIRIERVKNE